MEVLDFRGLGLVYPGLQYLERKVYKVFGQLSLVWEWLGLGCRDYGSGIQGLLGVKGLGVSG